MKIMTFNTQHCRNFRTGKIDFQVMADAILENEADFVGLNEIRGLGSDPNYQNQTPTLSKLTGMSYSFFAPALIIPDHGPYGNAVLSRVPIVSCETIPIPDPCPKLPNRHYETRCLIKVRLENGLTILVSHFGLNEDEQRNAVDTVLLHLEETNCILMGDFNMTPDNPTLAPIFAKMKDTSFLFSEPLLSFPSDEPAIKIDYIFTSPDLTVTQADIPALVASDHRPHTATIELKV